MVHPQEGSQGSAVSLNQPLLSVNLSPLARGYDLLSGPPAESSIHGSSLNCRSQVAMKPSLPEPTPRPNAE